MKSNAEPSFGKVHFVHGAGRWLFVMVSIVAAVAVVSSDAFPPLFAWALGSALLVFVLWVFRKTLLRIPAVETSEQGVIIRPDADRGCIFVRWEDLKEVVIWYDGRGAVKTTMVGLWAGKDFTHDNYGLYRPVRPYRQLPHRPHIQPDLLRWSVSMAVTRAHRISDLIEASGRQIPVYMSPLGSRELHRLSGTAPGE